jgi:PAS domain-containing protein
MGQAASDTLMRRIGLHKWSLDLTANVLHIESGVRSSAIERVSIPVAKLEKLYTPLEMAAVAAHWREAATKGYAGPAILPFVQRDGAKIQIESVASLEVRPDGTFLVGLYKTVEDLLKAQKRARLLKEFLDSFVQNSPSAIFVFDPVGRVLSANEALGKFLHLTSVRPLVGHTIDHLERMIDSKFMSIIKASLKMPQPSKGRHVLAFGPGLHQSVYWRCFPLAVDKEEHPPKVFCFDLHAAGPSALVA